MLFISLSLVLSYLFMLSSVLLCNIWSDSDMHNAGLLVLSYDMTWRLFVLISSDLSVIQQLSYVSLLCFSHCCCLHKNWFALHPSTQSHCISPISTRSFSNNLIILFFWKLRHLRQVFLLPRDNLHFSLEHATIFVNCRFIFSSTSACYIFLSSYYTSFLLCFTPSPSWWTIVPLFPAPMLATSSFLPPPRHFFPVLHQKNEIVEQYLRCGKILTLYI